MLDGADPGFGAEDDAAVGIAMRGDVFAGRLGLEHDRPQLFGRILGMGDLVGRRGDPPARHHLEEVGPAPDLLPRRPPDLVHPVVDPGRHPAPSLDRRMGLGGEAEIAVSPGLRKDPPAEEKARSRDQAFGQGLAQAGIGPPAVPDRREPLLQGFADDGQAFEQDVGGKTASLLLHEGRLHRLQMDVRVDQAREQKLPAAVDHPGRRGKRLARSLQGLPDATVFDDHADVFPRLGSGAVDQREVLQDRDVHDAPRRFTSFPGAPPAVGAGGRSGPERADRGGGVPV